MNLRTSAATVCALLVSACADRSRLARLDVSGELDELRRAGVTVKVQIADSPEAAMAFVQTAERGPDMSLIAVGPGYLLVRYAPSLRMGGDTAGSRAEQLGREFLSYAGPAAAARAALRGMVLDLMQAGVIPPRPLAPLPGEPSREGPEPSRHVGWGAALVAATLLGAWFTKRGRTLR